MDFSLTQIASRISGLWLAINSSACTLPLAHFLKKPVPLSPSLSLSHEINRSGRFVYLFQCCHRLGNCNTHAARCKAKPKPQSESKSKNSFFLFFFSLFLLTSQINSGVIKCVLSPESVSKGKRKRASNMFDAKQVVAANGNSSGENNNNSSCCTRTRFCD